MSEILEFKCPSCAGIINFDSTLQKMKCPYCDKEFEMDTLKQYDSNLNQEPDEMNWEVTAGQEWQEDEESALCNYVCKSCGGELIADENTASTACPFCDNQIVLVSRLSGTLKPDFVIPFKFNKEQAKTGLTDHLKGKFLLPKVFKDENHIDEIKGLYVPFWLFDSSVDATVNYKAAKEVRVWEDKNNRYTKTSYYSVRRAGTLSFENVPVDGSSKMDDALMESVEPFNLYEAVDFQTAYLAGYLTDKYDISADDSVHRANQRIKSSTEQIFQRTVNGYDSVKVENSRVKFFDSSVKYTLCPVWVLNTTWNGKKFTFAMNGQTGKFVGNLPCDMEKYFTLFGIFTVVITIAVYVIGHLLDLI